jgi:hypothetical protein
MSGLHRIVSHMQFRTVQNVHTTCILQYNNHCFRNLWEQVMTTTKCKEQREMNSDQSIAPVAPGSIKVDNQYRIPQKEQKYYKYQLKQHKGPKQRNVTWNVRCLSEQKRSSMDNTYRLFYKWDKKTMVLNSSYKLVGSWNDFKMKTHLIFDQAGIWTHRLLSTYWWEKLSKLRDDKGTEPSPWSSSTSSPCLPTVGIGPEWNSEPVGTKFRSIENLWTVFVMFNLFCMWY